MEKFIITPREDKTVTMTIRIERTLQERYNDLSARTSLGFQRYESLL